MDYKVVSILVYPQHRTKKGTSNKSLTLIRFIFLIGMGTAILKLFYVNYRNEQ